MKRVLAALGISGTLLFGASTVPIVPHQVQERGLESQERPLMDTPSGWFAEGDYAYFPDSGNYIIDIQGDCKGTGICVSTTTKPVGYHEIHPVGKWYDVTLLGDDGELAKVKGTKNDHYNIAKVKRTVTKYKPLLDSEAQAAATYVASSETIREPGASTSDSFTYSYTAGTNNLVALWGLEASVSATYNGTSMTAASNSETVCNMSYAYLATSVSSATLVYNYTSTTPHYFVYALAGVDQTAPLNSEVGGYTAGSVSSVTQNITAGADDIVVSEDCVNSSASPITITMGNSGTLVRQSQNSWTDGLARAWGYKESAGSTYTITWNFTSSAENNGLYGLSFKAAAAASTPVNIKVPDIINVI